MSSHAPIRCDVCREFMYLNSEIGRRTQTYRCPECSDRWAIVRLNSLGGVSAVRHTNERNAQQYGAAVAVGGLLGNLLADFFNRKRS